MFALKLKVILSNTKSNTSKLKVRQQSRPSGSKDKSNRYKLNVVQETNIYIVVAV